MKTLVMISAVSLSFSSCAQTSKNVSAAFTIQSNGIYAEKEGKIYVDANFRQVSKASAVYFLEKKLLGRDIVMNDGNSQNYWDDKKYFKDTPVVRYIYKYFDVKDGKLAFAASAAEWQGKPNYIFDGTAFCTNKDNKVTQTFTYIRGQLEGEAAEYNDDGSFRSRKLYRQGKDTNFLQTATSINPFFVGTWECVVPSAADWQETVLVNEYTANGTVHTYQNMFYNGNGSRMQTMDGSDTKSTGFWLYTPKSDKTGIIEYYFNGDLVQKNESNIVNSKTVAFKTVYYNPKYGTSNLSNYTMIRVD